VKAEEKNQICIENRSIIKNEKQLFFNEKGEEVTANSSTNKSPKKVKNYF
jgi:hypothetical protein